MADKPQKPVDQKNPHSPFNMFKLWVRAHDRVGNLVWVR